MLIKKIVGDWGSYVLVTLAVTGVYRCQRFCLSSFFPYPGTQPRFVQILLCKQHPVGMI